MKSPEVHAIGNQPSAHPEASLTHQQIRDARLAGLRALSAAGVGVLKSHDAHRLESDIIAGIPQSESVNQITGEHPVVHANVQDSSSGSQNIAVHQSERLH